MIHLGWSIHKRTKSILPNVICRKNSIFPLNAQRNGTENEKHQQMFKAKSNEMIEVKFLILDVDI